MKFSRLHYIATVFAIGTLLFVFLPSQTATASPCSISGNGSQQTPWLVQNSSDLQCFETGNWTPPGGQVGYLALNADVEKTTNVKLFGTSPSFALRFNGNNHTITVNQVTNFQGIFRDSRNSVFQNFSVASTNGSNLSAPSPGASGYGWVVENDYLSTFQNIHVSAPISNQNGGIIGGAYGSYVLNCSSSSTIGSTGAGGLIQTTLSESGANPPTRQAQIDQSHSTGSIGASSGGLLGNVLSDTKITRSYSTGNIDNGGAGGLAGTGTQPLSIETSYSTGDIGISSGGLLGQYASDFSISNSYSEGDISSYGGGLVGAYASGGSVHNSYSLGYVSPYAGGIFGNLFDDSQNYPNLPGLNALNIYVVGQIDPNGAAIASPGPNNPPSGSITTQSLTVSYSNALFDPNVSMGWSDVDAATVLVGYQGWGGTYKWISCTLNTPASITAMFATDPCSPSPTPTPTPSPTSTQDSSGVEHALLANTGVSWQMLALGLFAFICIGIGSIVIRKEFLKNK